MWKSHGNHTAITLQTYGNGMAITWRSHGNHTAITRQSHGNHRFLAGILAQFGVPGDLPRERKQPVMYRVAERVLYQAVNQLLSGKVRERAALPVRHLRGLRPTWLAAALPPLLCRRCSLPLLLAVGTATG